MKNNNNNNEDRFDNARCFIEEASPEFVELAWTDDFDCDCCMASLQGNHWKALEGSEEELIICPDCAVFIQNGDDTPFSL